MFDSGSKNNNKKRQQDFFGLVSVLTCMFVFYCHTGNLWLFHGKIKIDKNRIQNDNKNNNNNFLHEKTIQKCFYKETPSNTLIYDKNFKFLPEGDFYNKHGSNIVLNEFTNKEFIYKNRSCQISCFYIVH